MKSSTHDRMHCAAAWTSACRAIRIASCRWASLTFSSPSALKKFVVNWSRKPSGSAARPACIPSTVASSSAPSGCSSSCLRQGGMAAANTALCTRSSPCVPM